MELSLFYLFGIVLSLLLFWGYHRRPKNFPPGPLGLPVVGYLPFLGDKPFKTLTELGKKYGNVFSVKFGNSNVVVLNDWPAIKEALINQNEVFLGRPKNIMFERLFEYKDFGFVDGQPWKERRTFALRHLKNLGFGKSSFEHVVMNEIRDVIDKLKADDNESIDVENYFFLSFLRIIWSVIGGNLDCDDNIKHDFSSIVRILFHVFGGTNEFMFLPSLRHVYRKQFSVICAAIENFNNFIAATIDQHRASYEDGNIRDFVDAGLAHILSQKNNPQEDALSFTSDNILHICKNLFLGGTDTSHNTLRWGLLYMAVWPSFQEKVQQELDAVIGRHSLPCFQDRALLPYCSAVVLEIDRYISVVPFSILHTTTSKTELFGHTLPEGTVVLPNLWAVHHDPRYWEDPEVFRPERFLNAKGEVEKPEYLIPFSVGGRICPGKSLADMNNFLFLTCLLHQFSFSLTPGEIIPTLDPIFGLTLTPHPFSLVVKQRSHNLYDAKSS